MSSASGSVTGSRVRIGLSSIRQNDITGAPIRSEPKLGNACEYRSSRNAADASSSAAVTTPWPPRPWNRTWNMGASGFEPPDDAGPGWRSASLYLTFLSFLPAPAGVTAGCPDRIGLSALLTAGAPAHPEPGGRSFPQRGEAG